MPYKVELERLLHIGSHRTPAQWHREITSGSLQGDEFLAGMVTIAQTSLEDGFKMMLDLGLLRDLLARLPVDPRYERSISQMRQGVSEGYEVLARLIGTMNQIKHVCIEHDPSDGGCPACQGQRQLVE